MFRQCFGGLAVDGVLGEGFQFVERGSIEVEESRAGSWVVEETCEACWIAGFEVTARLDGRK